MSPEIKKENSMLSDVDLMFKDILRDLISGHETSSNLFICKLANYTQIEENNISDWVDSKSLQAPTKEQVLSIYKALNTQMKESIAEEQMQNFEELEIQADLITQILNSKRDIRQGWLVSVCQTLNRIVDGCKKT